MNKKFEEYINSPYRMHGLSERIFTTRSDETLTVDPETGRYYTVREVSKDKRMLHDELVYTKLFGSSVQQLMSLPHPALKILLYAISSVKPLSQTVVLNADDVSQYCEIANGTYYNNLYVLLERKILARKLGSNIEYWFDPNIFFNGNRLRVSKHNNKSELNLEDEI